MLIIMTSNLKPIKSLQIPRFNLIHTSTKTLNSLLRYKGSQPALFQVSSIFDQNLKNSLLLGMCYVGFSFLFFSFLWGSIVYYDGSLLWIITLTLLFYNRSFAFGSNFWCWWELGLIFIWIRSLISVYLILVFGCRLLAIF